MGIVVEFRHASALSCGYRSGRKSLRETPVILSTAKTRSGGTSSHCEMACGFMPSSLASGPIPPAADIARSRASFLLLMGQDESIALSENQALLHCAPKAMLYSVDMQLKDRLIFALERRRIDRGEFADLLAAAGHKVSIQAISQWLTGQTGPTRNKIPTLESILKLPQGWLLKDNPEPLPPLGPDDLEIFLKMLIQVGKAIPDSQRGPAIQVLKGLIPPEPKQPKTRQRAS